MNGLTAVEGKEASGPAGPAGEESFDCEGGRGSKARSNELRESRCANAPFFLSTSFTLLFVGKTNANILASHFMRIFSPPSTKV